MINIAICDDEEYFRDLIHELVTKYLDEVQIDYTIDIFHDGAKLCESEIDHKKYDIVFLDVNMQEMDGIETARYIRQNNTDAFIVFITAFVTYSPEGYKVNAIRYLLKGTPNFEVSLNECMDTIFNQMNIKNEKIKLSFSTGEREVYIDKIVFIESKLHKLELSLYEKEVKTYSFTGKLDDLTDLLEDHGFLRIHQSFLVNLKYVSQIHNYKAILVYGKDLPVPKQKYKMIKDAFIIYKGDM